MGQKLIIGIFIVLIGVAGYLFIKVNKLTGTPGVKNFDFTLQNSAYSPDTVKVKLGDTVVFNIDNRDNESHGLHLQQFGLAEAVPPLQKTSIQFVAS